MSAVKHTPGPWEIRFSKSGYPYKIKAPDQSGKRRGGVVDITRWGAISLPSSEEGQANARLIAAAPELLDAVRQLRELARREGWVHVAIKAADDAIAKVEGR